MNRVVDISEARKPPPEAVIAAYKLLTGLMPEWDPEDGWHHGSGYNTSDEMLMHVLAGLLLLLDEHQPDGPL